MRCSNRSSSNDKLHVEKSEFVKHFFVIVMKTKLGGKSIGKTSLKLIENQKKSMSATFNLGFCLIENMLFFCRKT